ncbi:MAG: TetR/AcrR family transcriptional regulator [Lentisphaeria bacterium]
MVKEITKADVILDATFVLLNSKPYHAIKLDEIAELAKVGKGTIYRYFKDKDDLFIQLIERGNEIASVLFRECIGGELGLREKLLGCAKKMHEIFLSSGAIFRIISEELELHNRFKGTEQVLRRSGRPLDTTVEFIFNESIKSGEVITKYSGDFLASMLCGMIRNLSFENQLKGKGEPNFVDAIDFFLNSLKTN